MSLTAHDLAVSLDRHPVLHGVSVDLRPGEMLGLIGPNGAGKSTLLRALAGLVRPTSGTVTSHGRSLGSLKPRERAVRTAFVAQDTALAADLTVTELVLMGRYAHRERLGRTTPADTGLAHEALAAVGMTHLAERSVPSLSGGERQLVQIARALAQHADTLLLDEPTSALDVHHQLRVFAILRDQVAAGRSIAVVLHDLNDASRYCDRLALVHRGRLAACGAPPDVLSTERIAEVYRIDADVHDDPHGHLYVHPIRHHNTPTCSIPT